MQKSDGMNYAPEFSGTARKVVDEGEFEVSAIGLDHGHIYGMINGLLEAGATLRQVYDPDEAKVDAFLTRYPQARKAESEEEILRSAASLIVSAVRPDKRGSLAVRTLRAGKNFFVDKPGFLTLEDLSQIRTARDESGKKYYIYYAERIHVEGAVCAEQLIQSGGVGKVLNVTKLAPHRLNPSSRPDWFWDCARSPSREKQSHSGYYTI